jgi:hypothetical protein
MYRGLSPHKIMPMPGTHQSINLTGNSRVVKSGQHLGRQVISPISSPADADELIAAVE